MDKKITLVDIDDKVIGYCEKMKAHKEAKLHRAFSVFVYGYKNDKLCMLLQKRAAGKYHSGGLWTNACCSHPRIGESLNEAVSRRLKEELNVTLEAEELFSFMYFYRFGDDCAEYEWDHVFCAEYSGEVKSDPEEIEEIEWIPIDELKRMTEENPDKFTVWFFMSASKVIKYIEDKVQK